MSDELADLCLSFLKPPRHSGGSWTLNPTALADAIRARWTLIDPATVDSDFALSLHEAVLAREIAENSAEIERLAFGEDGKR